MSPKTEQLQVRKFWSTWWIQFCSLKASGVGISVFCGRGKNRFGAADEIGVWEMTGDGLSEVTNPSALFLGLAERVGGRHGCVCGLRGESPATGGDSGFDGSRSVWFATAGCCRLGWQSPSADLGGFWETRCGVIFSQQDVYLNVAGGLRIAEPAADLAVAAALLSAAEDTPLPLDLV